MPATTASAAPRIIAIGGPKYSGKDTAASSLLGLRSLPKKDQFVFCRMPFAQGVKNICQEVFGWDQSILEDPALKETKTVDWPYIEPRRPMMDVANWMRDIYGGDVWVRRNIRRINEIHATRPYWAYVITDWRFPEETEWLNSLDPAHVLKLYILRDSAEENLAALRQEGDEMAINPSEAHHAEIRKAADVVLANNNAIHHLQNDVLNAVRNHFGYWYPDEV